MTVSTLRPTSTSLNTGTLTGGASAHAVLSDNSDSSYVTYDAVTEGSTLGLTDLTLPAGAIIKSAAVRLRTASETHVSPDFVITTTLFARLASFASGIAQNTNFSITWGSPSTTTVFSYALAMTDAEMDAATLQLVAMDSAGDRNIYEAYVDVTYVAKPVVAVNDLPSTIDDTNLPTITWADTLDSDGGAQYGYQVKVFNAAQYGAGGFNPSTSVPFVATGTPDQRSVIGTGTSWTPTVTLPDDTYRAYVLVFQQVNGALHLSDWDYEQFDIEVDLPGISSVTVTPHAPLARHAIDIECDAGGDATTDLLEVQYSYDDGVTWAPLRTAEGDDGYVTPDDDAATVWDFEAPNGQEASYRVRALHDYSGVFAASAWVEESATWSSSQEWLVHPLDPSLALPVVIADFASRQRPTRRGVFQCLGSSRVVTVSDKRGPETGSVVLQVERDDHDALDALIESGTPLLLIGAAGSAIKHPLYISVGDTERVEGNGKGFCTWTLDTLAWTKVGRPSGGLLTVPE